MWKHESLCSVTDHLVSLLKIICNYDNQYFISSFRSDLFVLHVDCIISNLYLVSHVLLILIRNNLLMSYMTLNRGNVWAMQWGALSQYAWSESRSETRNRLLRWPWRTVMTARPSRGRGHSDRQLSLRESWTHRLLFWLVGIIISFNFGM